MSLTHRTTDSSALMHVCIYVRKKEREEERRGMIRREREKRKNKGKQIREVG